MAGRARGEHTKSSPDWVLLQHGSLHAVVDAVAHIDVKTPWLTKERLVAGGAAAIAVASRLILRISLGFHNHAPQQAAFVLAFH